MASTTPNIDKLEAVLRSLGDGAQVSFQRSDVNDRGFFSTARRITLPSGESTWTNGQGDTLAAAFRAEAESLRRLTTPASVADLEQAAA